KVHSELHQAQAQNPRVEIDVGLRIAGNRRNVVDAKNSLSHVHAFTACMSIVMVTSSPTRTPPVSSAEFHVSPNSLRLIFVVAVNPRRVLPHGSFAGALGPSMMKVTLRVTPWIVKSPSTSN